MDKNTEVAKLYNLLCSLISGLTPDINSATLRDGSGERLNGYAAELVQLTGDKRLADYSLTIKTVGTHGAPYVTGEEYSRNLLSLATYLWSTNDYLNYNCTSPPDRASGANAPSMTQHVITTQQNEQTTDVDIHFNQTIMQLSDSLSDVMRNFPDEDTKENKFAKVLKKVLPTAKDSLGIISLILTTASQMGLAPHEIAKLLGLTNN